MPECSKCSAPILHVEDDYRSFPLFKNHPSQLCFDCNQKLRLSFRNERTLYSRSCDGTGKKIISTYTEDAPFPVYEREYWYSDNWDPLEYGQDYDFSRPFFEQYAELQKKVPRIALSNVNGVNSDYCNMTYGNKDCYLIFGGDCNEDTFFGTLCMQNRDCLDVDNSNQNELSYMLAYSVNCYGSQFVFDSKNCRNCYFVSDCIGCSECILCTNLVNRSFCINNEQYSEEEYYKKKKELINGSYEGQRQMLDYFKKLRKRRVVKYAHLISCENCQGDYLTQCKNAKNCYEMTDCEDMKDIIFANKCKDSLNCGYIGDNGELCYNTQSTFGAYRTYCSFFVIDSSDIFYSEYAINSRQLFGCSGLRNNQYCILNQQYSKQDYLSMIEKIIAHMKQTGEWGKFFPTELSCYPYNETTAYYYYPLNEGQAKDFGFKWKKVSDRKYMPQTITLPDSISETDDSVIDSVLACTECMKNFKILSKELAFYRKMNIPVPRMCPDCRHEERRSFKNPQKLWKGQCAKCYKEFDTTYSPDAEETVCCEACYLQEIY